MVWRDSIVLITGGTGSFGRKLVEIVMKECPPKKLIVFSRDELKQHEMRQRFPDSGNSPLRYFIGDVRDATRLHRALNGVDVVVHAAALKQVPACEYNPIEAILTNVMGARNVIDAAIDQGVKRVIALSTDKSVNPINLYGATKLCSEKLFTQSNTYSVGRTLFGCVRYGNVIGSRGSVIPLFLDQRKTGRIAITDRRMTRFWITLEQGVRFVLRCLSLLHGGEVFIPKIPSTNIMDLAQAIAPNCDIDYIGIRPGEKLHELLIGEDEARHAVELEDMFIIHPLHPWWSSESYRTGKTLPDGFTYASNNNPVSLSVAELKRMVISLEFDGADVKAAA